MPNSRLLSIDELLPMLRNSPSIIDEDLVHLTPEQLRTVQGHGDWSANDVLAHIRSCADVWGGCIGQILKEDLPTIRAIDPRTWMKSTDYPDLDFHTSFLAYTAQRTDLVRLLESLSDKEWMRSATVIGAGKALNRTALFYARWLAIHERPHLKQIERIVSTARV